MTVLRALRALRPDHPQIPLGVLAALLALVTLGAGGAAGQSTQRPAGAFFEVSAGSTRLDGGASTTTSAAMLLRLDDRWAFGAVATLLPGSRHLSGEVPGSDLELGVAWGGVSARLRVAGDEGTNAWLQLTAGAGNGKISLAVAGTRIAADNFGVLVSELGGSLRVRGPLYALGAVGFRATFEVDDLPGITSEQLAGPSVRMGISLRHF